jgi:hypothetical protein
MIPEKPAREVVEAALLFGRQLEKVIDLANYVDSVERLNQLSAEAEGRAALAEKAEAEAVAKRAAALARLAEALAAKSDEADLIVATAKQEAKRLRESADSYAIGVKDDADLALRVSTAQADAVKSEAADILETAKAEANAVQGEVASAKLELAEVQKQLADARAVVAKLMGIS